MKLDVLLEVSFCPKQALSRTRRLADAYLAKQRGIYPELQVQQVDLEVARLPDIGLLAAVAKSKTIGGVELTPEEQVVWTEIGGIATRFMSADEVVLVAPMWNFSLPYKLKHYLDVVAQPGIAFRYGEQGAEGLGRGRPLTLVTTRGGVIGDSPYNHQTPLLKTLAGFLDFDYREIVAEGLDAEGPERGEAILREVITRLS
ncbi:MAG: NAD(P)H-dependent oxidoreductase [Gammaproteobacteria bacterium]|nr:NAD(P)H-dependent oxidoreductase [Gammaproteobacteria bacterium]